VADGERSDARSAAGGTVRGHRSFGEQKHMAPSSADGTAAQLGRARGPGAAAEFGGCRWKNSRNVAGGTLESATLRELFSLPATSWSSHPGQWRPVACVLAGGAISARWAMVRGGEEAPVASRDGGASSERGRRRR
jgi:hypothetical protein